MKLVLSCSCLFFFQLGQSQKIDNQFALFIDAGIVYGISQENKNQTDYQLHHRPSFQSSIGFRVTNKKDRHSFQFQAGYTTAVSSMSVNGKHFALINNISNGIYTGPLNSTSHMAAVKMAYLLKVKHWQTKKFTIKVLAGTGLNYVFNFDGQEYFFEGRTTETQEYFLSLNLDRKQIDGINPTEKIVPRLPSIQGHIAVQVNKNNTPFGVALYWCPAVTPSIQYTYSTGRNFVFAASGNAGQMQNAVGVQFIYTKKVKKY